MKTHSGLLCIDYDNGIISAFYVYDHFTHNVPVVIMNLCLPLYDICNKYQVMGFQISWLHKNWFQATRSW